MNLLRQNHQRYLEDHNFLRFLSGQEVCIPSDFITNEAGINAFWETYYAGGVPRVVLCGINPGRFGAGMTGIPFVDFASLSQMIPGVARRDQERSATFFAEVIRRFGGPEAFFQSFYVTNYSSVGYVRSGRNCNFYSLSEPAQAVIRRNFQMEMAIVVPRQIISLGVTVHEVVCRDLSESVNCRVRLPHPAWISTYRRRQLDEWADRYVEVLRNQVM